MLACTTGPKKKLKAILAIFTPPSPVHQKKARFYIYMRAWGRDCEVR
jgi:hypothetical protein